jgi:hypothetical protein
LSRENIFCINLTGFKSTSIEECSNKKGIKTAKVDVDETVIKGVSYENCYFANHKAIIQKPNLKMY